jgi:hypothetical protein
MNRSQLRVMALARSISPWGMDWPKEIVALFTGPPHAGQSGANSPWAWN